MGHTRPSTCPNMHPWHTPDATLLAYISTAYRTSTPPMQWQSDACFPGGYISRPAMNPLLRLCEGASPRGAPATMCTASTGSRDLSSATDTNVYSSAAIVAVAGTNGQPIAWFEAALPGGAQAVSRVSVKGWYGTTTPLSVVLLLQGGGRVQVATVTAAENYNWVHTLGSWQVRAGDMVQA